MAVGEDVRTAVEERCRALGQEFPELTRLELTVAPDGDGHAASAHAIGKNTEAATHGSGGEPRQAADQVIDKLRHQLRKSHDKRIFGRRREAQNHNPKRG